MSDDAAELEREAEAARARLADTADQLRARMSPGQMMDEVLNQFRGGDGSQMLANLRNQARDNPMALALVGSGLAWLMMGSGPDLHRKPAPPAPPRPLGAGYPPPGASIGEGTWTPGSGARPATDPSHRFGGPSGMGVSSAGGASDSGGSSGIGQSASNLAQGASDALSSAGQAVGDRLHKAGDQAGAWAHDLRNAGSNALSGASQTVSGAAQGVGDALSGAAHGVGDGVSHAVEGVRRSAADFGQQARNGFFDILEREPLVIGAIGVAVGAAIGALLPATEIEREHLAPAGEALKDKAAALVDQGVSGAKEVASEVYGTVRDEADRQGLLPGDTPIAEKIGAVVRAAGETADAVVERHVPKAEASGDDGESPKAPNASAGDRDEAPASPKKTDRA